MKKLYAVTVLVAALSLAPAALASPPTRAHVQVYLRAYAQVREKFGHRAPGCNLVRLRGSCHVRASDAAVARSYATLRSMLAPPLVPRMSASVGRSVIRHGYAATTAVPGSGLAECIIRRESGGNPQAVNPNGHYGEGQWDISTWRADGGGRYAATPLGASKSEQTAIINEQIAAGHTSQWTNYDGC